MTVWRWRGDDDEAWAALDEDTGRRVEDAYQSFVAGEEERATLKLEPEADADGRPRGRIDFRTMEQVIKSPGAGAGERRRRLLRAAEAEANSEDLGDDEEMRIEWGHGQDPVSGHGFATYGDDTARILEEAFAKYQAGENLKGVMITGENACDYLVDFKEMQQLRLATRRVRHVYRHSVGADGARAAAGAAAGGLSSALAAQQRSCTPGAHRPSQGSSLGKTSTTMSTAASGPLSPLLKPAAAATSPGSTSASSSVAGDHHEEAESKSLAFSFKMEPVRSTGSGRAAAARPREPAGDRVKCVDAVSLLSLLVGMVMRKERA